TPLGEDPPELLGDARRGEALARLSAAGRAHSPSQRVVGHEPEERVRPCGDVRRRHEQPTLVLANRLGSPTVATRDDSNAAGLRLRGDASEGFASNRWE